MKKILSALIVLLAAAPLRGGEAPYLLADVERGPSMQTVATGPSGFFELGGRLFFSTAAPNSLDQGILWSTDGTAPGTVQVSTTLCIAHCNAITPLGSWRGVTLLDVANSLYDPIFPTHRLARTDGTTAGTYFLHEGFGEDLEIHPLPGSGGFFFSAFSGSYYADELWKSDGTLTGTVPFRDGGSQPFFNPHSFRTWRGRLYFVASRALDGETGLWSIDGTPGGTRFLHAIWDLNDSWLAPVVVTPSHLYFASGNTGEDLWVTDGTPESTHLLADFPPVPCDSGCDIPDLFSLAASGDAVFWKTLRAGHSIEIWRSDGTEAGTRALIELPKGIEYADLPRRVGDRWLLQAEHSLWAIDDGFTRLERLDDCGGSPCPWVNGGPYNPVPGIWLFTGFDDTETPGLWATDGTSAGSRLLARVCPEFKLSPGSPDLFPAPDGRLYFRACAPPLNYDHIENSQEIWVTDGTPAGTWRAGGQVSSAGFFHGLVYYGSSPPAHPAAELRVTDGKPGPGKRVAILRRNAPGSDLTFSPSREGALFGTSRRDGQVELWRSDGTPGGTWPFFEISGESRWYFGDFLDLGGPFQLFLLGRHDGDPGYAETPEIWRTDGTARGTRQVAVLQTGNYIESWTSWNGSALFIDHESGSCAFWISDGTKEGTRKILTVPPEQDCASEPIPLGSRFVFLTAGKDTTDFFVSDGTPAGTRSIAHLEGRAYGSQHVQAGGTVYVNLTFSKGYEISGAELWRTDGSAAGTRRASSLARTGELYAFRDSLYVTASLNPESEGGRGLFRIPLSGGEPVLLAQVLGHEDRYPSWPKMRYGPAGDRLAFTLFEEYPDGNLELWSTDGTPQGTRKLQRFLPWPGDRFSPEPEDIASSGDRIFFAASDGQHGRELWESNGTPEGTRILDLAPGGFSAIPIPFPLTFSQHVLFFAADDGRTGVEPWALRLP